MIQKDGLNFVNLCFKSRASDKYDVNYIWLYSKWSLKVRGWMLKRRWNARCTAVADSVLMNSRTQKNLVLHSRHFALNWRCCTLDEHSSDGIWKCRISSFKCHVDHSHTIYSSGNIDVRNWVDPFESRSIVVYSRHVLHFTILFPVLSKFHTYTAIWSNWSHIKLRHI